MTAMSVRRLGQTAPRACDSLTPFLYQTRTIRGRLVRHISGESSTASEKPTAEAQEGTAYKPVLQAWRSDQNEPQNSAGYNDGKSRSRGGDGNGLSQDRRSGRKSILYPSLMSPHERSEAVKRERAKQAADELGDTHVSDMISGNAKYNTPLRRGSHKGQPSAMITSNDFSRRRKKRLDAIPFAKESMEADDSAADSSTITPSERKVFERLFRAGAASKLQPKPPPPSKEKLGVIGHEGHRRGATRLERPAPQLPSTLESMSKAAHRSVVQQPQLHPTQISMTEDGLPQSHSALHAQGRANNSISKLTKKMQAAESDYQCWRIFTNRLDQYLAMLAPPDPKDRQNMARLVAEILPAVLVACAKTLRSRFPGSTLALGVLPALKCAGAQAYAIGCSTALYNTHMSILYTQYTDISAVIDVLQEMDREVYSFDDETHAILDKILYDARGVKEGVLENLSPATTMLWSTERMQRSVRDVEKWRDIVEERRQSEALRLARQKDELEEAVDNDGGGEGWMLKEGEYVSSRSHVAHLDDAEDGQHSRRKTRGAEIQESIDALLPEGWEERHNNDFRKKNEVSARKQDRVNKKKERKEIEQA